MKLRNILIAAATMGVMFASANRTDIVGYTAGDYSDMNTYPHNASGQNVAFTSGDSFEAVWTDGGTTWGFAGGDADELVNMLWANGTFGLSVGLSMDSGTAAVDGGAAEVAGETTMDLGFGMNLAGWDMGFNMGTADGAPMMLNARGNLGFWAFDTMTFGYSSSDAYTTIDVNMYGLKEWGAATGMFAMGFTSTDNQDGWGTTDAVSLLNTGFSVESTLTDWCDLRIGYNKSFNVGAETGGVESQEGFNAGVGFNLGSVQLDMTLTDLGGMMSNPIHYLNGRNTTALTTEWTLSYNW